MSLKHIPLLAILLILSVQLQAQMSLGLNAKVYDPTGVLNRNIDRTPAGISITTIHQKPESRFSLGGELGVAMYANEHYQYDLTDHGFPGESVEVDEEDCFWTLHALARYDLVKETNFKTFAEVRLGMTTFFSSRLALEENPRIDDEFEFHGTAFNSGLGGGLAINPGGLFSKNAPGRLWIEMTIGYNTGSRATYRNIPESANGQMSLDEGHYRSLTNYVDYRVGVLFGL
ncbi:MAG: hypothetical protein ACR2MX_14165 [Cyclobacteriaceae bacterium]